MDTEPRSKRQVPAAPRWQLPALLLLAAGFESLFVFHGLGWFDEGWALYAARRLHEGGRLYVDTFFLFPPGHLLPAWLGYALDPPGIVPARVLYGLFAVALAAALYRLGLRLMPPAFALLGGALLAVAAPESHLVHLLFGWRYLVFAVLSLLAFARFLETGQRGWMVLAGVWCGVMLSFRLSPAFGVACGVGVAAVAAAGRRGLRDAALFAAGLAAAALPLLAWLAWGPGFERAWTEAVVRLMGLQSAQSLPFAPAAWPERWDRDLFEQLFVAVQLRAYPLLVLGYGVVLAVHRGRHRDGPWPHALLLAVVVWAGVYLLRIGGRSDDHHLYSALPPLCLLLAHAVFAGFTALFPRLRTLPELAAPALCLLVFFGWVFLMRSDEYLTAARRGVFPVRSADPPLYLRQRGDARMVDRKVELLRRWTRPGDTILNVSLTPMLYVLADRTGPGHFDVVMPGTFRDEDEERAFVERLRRDPPAAVVFPVIAFDRLRSRSVWQTAPLLAAWVQERYRALEPPRNPFVVMVPREVATPPDADAG